MYNSDDIVEEKSTGRRGKVAASGTVGQPLSRWTVYFQDGIPPMVKDFTDPNELRLISRPGESGPPRLIPRDPVV